MKAKRRRHEPEFKARVALEALKGVQTIQQLAILLRTHTAVSNDWIAAKLAMGHPGSVSRVVSAGRADNSTTAKLLGLEFMLIREQ